MDNLKVLLWDIETSHNIVASFGLYNQNINYTEILQDWFMISAAWKWRGEKKVHSVSVTDEEQSQQAFKDGTPNDYHVVKTLHEVLSQADVIVHHNGDDFDLKKFNARALFHGLDPIPPTRTIDTLKVARKYFNLTSNRLDYIAQFLSLGKKMDTPKGLWLQVLRGNVDAVKTMVKYNKHDVVILESVFERFLPFMNNDKVTPFTKSGCCSQCKSSNYQRRGWRITKAFKYPRYQCQSCGSWFSGAASDRSDFSLRASNMVKLEDTNKELICPKRLENLETISTNTPRSIRPKKLKKTEQAEIELELNWKKKDGFIKGTGEMLTTYAE